MLMEDDKFLLECNLLDIVTTNGEQQEYWLLAIQAAQEAGLIQTQAQQQHCIRTTLGMGIKFAQAHFIAPTT